MKPTGTRALNGEAAGSGQSREGAEPTARHKPAISVLVPVSERPSALEWIYAEYSAPLRQESLTFEFIFIVEPKFQELTLPLEELRKEGEPIQVLQTSHPIGDTGLIRAGAERANHSILLTLPPYPRIEPDRLPALLAPVLEGKPMAVARRWPRRDSWLNRLQNRVFHLLLTSVGSGGQIKDVACGVRAIHREVFDVLPFYGDFHRFLPLLALRAGFEVVEVEAAQHPGDRQPRIYGPGVYLRRVLDVLGLYFLMRFTDKPLRFFGLVGSGGILLGGAILVVLAVQRIGGQAIADRPLLLLGTLLVILGVQAIALGLVGEVIVHVNAPARERSRDRSTAQEPERVGYPPLDPDSDWKP